MNGACKWAIGFAVVLVLAIIAVVFAVILPGKKDKNGPPTMYFAMYLGDNERVSWMLAHEKFREGECSLEMNKRNTREAISAMKDVDQRYGFILYSNTVNTTDPMDATEALAYLDNVAQIAGSSYTQESVAKEYTSKKKDDDLFVFYIPCDYDYREDDQDVSKFVAELRSSKALEKSLIVSNARVTSAVAELYGLNDENVAGKEQDIPRRIVQLSGHSIGTTSVASRSTRSPGTRSTSATHPSPSSTMVPKRRLSCLFIGDVFNYGSNTEGYDMELELLSQVAYDVFALPTLNSQLALWAYGYTNYPKNVLDALNKMAKNSDEFNQLLMKIDYDADVSDVINTERAIKAINEMLEEKLNCIVFFTAQSDTTGLPKINPKNEGIETLVAVGLRGTDPINLVPAGGKVVSVPYYYKDEDVVKIVNAIKDNKPWTTSSPTTSRKPYPRACLMIGDLYNFGADEDKYVNEVEFIYRLGYDYFAVDKEICAGVWAYGYTTFPNRPNLGGIVNSLHNFKYNLEKMTYYNRSDPFTTATAIKAINGMGDDIRVNCWVFFTAQNDTELLPILNPRNSRINKIVAVGLANTDVTSLVKLRGEAISIPSFYTEEHVKKVLDAILSGRSTPAPSRSTTPIAPKSPSTRTTMEPLPTRCLMIGDLYNFGADEDKYLDEAEFISRLGYDYFATDSELYGGLWAYGYTTFPNRPNLGGITTSYPTFYYNPGKMTYHNKTDPLTTATAIEAINEMGDSVRVTCWVFFSAQNDTRSLPPLDPQNRYIDRIVAVGLAGTDVSSLVRRRGEAVSVPSHYTDEDVNRVLDAILPERGMTTPAPPTTTAEPEPRRCLMIGDLYNFGADEEKYIDEAKFISRLGYAYFTTDSELYGGLWAYGYTTFPNRPNLGGVTRSLQTFEYNLKKMTYHNRTDPFTTAIAIEKINDMGDDIRVNCWVFFSAQSDTSSLPRLNPRNIYIDRIVAVGLAGADLTGLIGGIGEAVSVPLHYTDEDVTKVLNAVLPERSMTTPTPA